MDGHQDRLARWALRTWLAIGLLVLLGMLWWVLREPLGLVLPPVAIAAVLVYVLNPAVTALSRRGVPRAVGALLAYLGAGAVVWAVLAVVGPLLVEQARGLVAELPAIGGALQTAVNEQLTRLGVPASEQLDLETPGIATAIQDWLTTNRDEVLALARGAGSVVTWVAHLALALALGPILAFYALSDLDRLSSGAARLLPPSAASCSWRSSSAPRPRRGCGSSACRSGPSSASRPACSTSCRWSDRPSVASSGSSWR